MKEFATITAKGQVTIPRAIRKALELRQGDQLRWDLEDGGVRVWRLVSRSGLPRKTRRPLPISESAADGSSVLLAMITSARRSSWPLDWPIYDLAPTGLAEACLVCFKLFSPDERLILGQLGQLAAIDRRGVRANLHQLIADEERPA